MSIAITPYIPLLPLDMPRSEGARTAAPSIARQPLDIGALNVDQALEPPAQQLARQLQNAFAGLDDQQKRQRLLDTSSYGPAELKTLAHVYIALGATDVAAMAGPEAASDRSVDRLTFDPSRWGDVSVLLAAIAALNLARTVSAQMQGKFAQLAYAAAIAQSNATVSAGRAEMMAAMSGAVVAIGLAVGGTVMALRAHTARHQDVKLNQGPANKLQDQLAEAHATMARPAPRLTAPDAGTPSRRTATARDGNPVPSDNTRSDTASLDDAAQRQNKVDVAAQNVLVQEAEVARLRADVRGVDAGSEQLTQAQARLDNARADLARAEGQADEQRSPHADRQRSEINGRERAVLSGELRLSESQVRELQLKSRLNQRAIDKLLSYSQLLMASSTVVSAMVLASVRVQAYQEQANGILRGAEMGTHKAMTEAQGQVSVEDSADLGKLLEALKQVMQQTTDVMAHVASRPV
jgi:hypothetical protein